MNNVQEGGPLSNSVRVLKRTVEMLYCRVISLIPWIDVMSRPVANKIDKAAYALSKYLFKAFFPSWLTTISIIVGALGEDNHGYK